MELYQKNRAAFAVPQGDALDRGAMEIYQANRAAFTDPVKPVAPPKAPPRPAGFGQRLGDFFTSVKDASNNTLNAISRGAVDAVNDASNTVVGIGGVAVNAAIKGAQHATGDKSIGAEWERWYNSGDTGDINPLQVSASATDEMFGKKQGGVYQFVENATAFTAALETGNELSGVAGIAPGAARTLAKVGLIGLAQAAVTDPRAARLSDMIENGAPALSNPLTQFLKSDGKDSEALARLKSGLEGSMTGYAVDKFIGALGSVVKSVIGDSAAPAADAAIQTANDAKPDAVTVERTPDGGATIVHNPDAVTEPQGFLSGKPGRYAGFRGADPANPLGDTEKFGGTYIAQNKTYAQNFVDTDGGPRIMHNAEIKVSNPFVLQTGDNAERLAQAVADAQGTPEKAAELAKSYRTNGVAYLEPEARTWLADNGYDAVTSEIDGGNASVPGHGDPVMIALDGESVKLTPHDAEAVASPSVPIPSGIIFNSVADAESHAAAINENFRATSIPEGHVDDMDIAALKEAVKNAPEGASAVAVLPKGVFNYNYLGGTAATQAVVESLATKLEHAFPALRNVVAGVGDTGDELTAKAMKLATQGDADSWLSSARNDADVLHAMPARQMARKFLIKSLAGKVAELSQAADINPDNVLANANLKAAGTQLLHLFSESASIDSGAGRLLQSLKNRIGAVSDDATTVATDDVAAEAPNADPLTDMLTNDDWRQMARQIRLSDGDPALILDSMVSKVGQRAAEHDPSKWELFNAFRINMMLSGPKTSIVLATSQALASIEAPIEYWAGGVLKGDTALRQQGADMLGGMWTNAGAAWKIAAKAFRMGESVLDNHAGIAQDSGQDTAAGGPMGWLSTVMKVPTRVIMSVDEFFKNLNYLNSVRALSMRAADQDVQTAGSMSLKDASEYKAQKLAEDLQSATDVNGRALNPVALSYARDATFQTPLTGFGATLQDAAQAHPWLRVIAPFIRTPYNLARYAWQRTPVLGALAGDMRADIEAGGQRQAVALGKQAVGAAIWGSAAMAVVSGNMTGAGPTDPDLRKQWGPEGAGNQPYSLRIPGTNEWISYRRLDQLGTPLSMIADIVEMSGHLRVTDTENSYVKVMAALSADLLSKTFLSGIANLMDAMHSGDANAMQRLVQNTAASLIPAAARQLDTDDRYREVRGMVDALRERIPGLSNTLEAKRNILGEPAMKPPGEFHQQWNPFTLTPGGRVDPVQDALVQLGKGMSMPAEVVNGIDLTDRKMWKRADGKLQSPYDRTLELMAHPKDGGDSIRKQLTDYINSDDWKDASPGSEQDPGGERRLTVARMIQGAQKEAMGEVMEEYPKLEQAMEDAQGIRKSALEAPADSAPVPWTGTGNRIPTRDRPALIQ